MRIHEYMIRLFGVLSLILICFSCHRKTERQPSSDITLEEIIVSEPNPSLRIEEIYDSLEIICLDNSVLLSGIGDVKVFDDKFYVLDRRKLIVALYDLQGNYISHINRQGRGPDEYISIFSMKIDPIAQKVLLTDNFQKKVFVYDLNLNHERTIRVNFHVGEVAGLRDNLFLHGQSTGIDRESHKALNNEIIIMNTEGEVVKSFIPTPSDVSTTLPSRSISDVNDGGFIVHPTLSDTLYYVSSSFDQVYPRYRINFRLKGWTLINRQAYKKESRYRNLNTLEILNQLEQDRRTIAWGYLVNSDSMLLIRLGNFNPVFCLYNKKNKQSISYFGETIKGDNALRLLSAFPFSSSGDRLYSGVDIQTLKTMSSVENFSSEWVDKIGSLDPYDNPVIISYKIR